jgi:hypothetical protein
MERSTGIGDYHLKDCMVEQKCKNNISGRNIASLLLVCLRNGQTDPPRINGGYSKE